MGDPILYGPGYSTYTRSVRLALAEKGVAYQHVEVDFLQGMPDDHVSRHPFGKVPAFEHDGFSLYEVCAIGRYVDEAFDGPPLQPAEAVGRARMTQVISIIDSYTYAPLISQVVIQRLVMPMLGADSDEETIASALPAARKALGTLEGLLGDQAFLAGEALSLADLHLVPIYVYFSLAPEGRAVLENHSALRRWADRVCAQKSVRDFCPAELASP